MIGVGTLVIGHLFLLIFGFGYSCNSIGGWDRFRWRGYRRYFIWIYYDNWPKPASVEIKTEFEIF